MNFLAHLHLSEPTPEALLGNFLGDFVTGDPSDRYPAEICRGIHLHRQIDAFTDNHKVWKRSRVRLSPERRRFASIIIDIFYDYFLTRHWDRFETDELGDAIAGYYLGLQQAAHHVADPKAGRALRSMVAENWLGRYASLEGIAHVIDGVSERSPRVAPMAGAIEELAGNEAAMEQDFLAFYPELLAFARAGGRA